MKISSKNLQNCLGLRHLLVCIKKLSPTKISFDENTVKSFNFVGTKYCGLTTLGMFMDTLIRGFQIICNIINMNKYFDRILNSGIVLPTKYTKLIVQRI